MLSTYSVSTQCLVHGSLSTYCLIFMDYYLAIISLIPINITINYSFSTLFPCNYSLSTFCLVIITLLHIALVAVSEKLPKCLSGSLEKKSVPETLCYRI